MVLALAPTFGWLRASMMVLMPVKNGLLDISSLSAITPFPRRATHAELLIQFTPQQRREIEPWCRLYGELAEVQRDTKEGHLSADVGGIQCLRERLAEWPKLLRKRVDQRRLLGRVRNHRE